MQSIRLCMYTSVCTQSITSPSCTLEMTSMLPNILQCSSSVTIFNRSSGWKNIYKKFINTISQHRLLCLKKSGKKNLMDASAYKCLTFSFPFAFQVSDKVGSYYPWVCDTYLQWRNLLKYKTSVLAKTLVTHYIHTYILPSIARANDFLFSLENW